jgi:hypothetical protein
VAYLLGELLTPHDAGRLIGGISEQGTRSMNQGAGFMGYGASGGILQNKGYEETEHPR